MECECVNTATKTRTIGLNKQQTTMKKKICLVSIKSRFDKNKTTTTIASETERRWKRFLHANRLNIPTNRAYTVLVVCLKSLEFNLQRGSLAFTIAHTHTHTNESSNLFGRAKMTFESVSIYTYRGDCSRRSSTALLNYCCCCWWYFSVNFSTEIS